MNIYLPCKKKLFIAFRALILSLPIPFTIILPIPNRIIRSSRPRSSYSYQHIYSENFVFQENSWNFSTLKSISKNEKRKIYIYLMSLKIYIFIHINSSFSSASCIEYKIPMDKIIIRFICNFSPIMQ